MNDANQELWSAAKTGNIAKMQKELDKGANGFDWALFWARKYNQTEAIQFLNKHIKEVNND